MRIIKLFGLLIIKVCYFFQLSLKMMKLIYHRHHQFWPSELSWNVIVWENTEINCLHFLVTFQTLKKERRKYIWKTWKHFKLKRWRTKINYVKLIEWKFKVIFIEKTRGKQRKKFSEKYFPCEGIFFFFHRLFRF